MTVERLALLFPVIFVAAGVCFQASERFWPLRSFSARRAVRIDVLALFWAGGLTALYAAFVPGLVARSLGSLGAPPAPAEIAGWGLSSAGVAVLAILVTDFLNYWGHRLNHTRWLWPTHAFHHSAARMYWLAGVRESPVHYLILTLPSTVVAALLPPSTLLAWLLGAMVAPVLNQHLIHSNVRVRMGKLGKVLVTPEYHFVHHSVDPRWSNSNFGFVFSVWDRWFGTYTDPASLPPDHALGLDYAVSNPRLFLGLPRPEPTAGPLPSEMAGSAPPTAR
jgi:sterol desaturase/sphingolipid hydroxylase (fatty acid hydroxylase superfamily)